MASPTKETWGKRNRRDAKLLRRRQKRLRRGQAKKATIDQICK